jgi:zinc D-Ala-D-Ala carboxypeptidase
LTPLYWVGALLLVVVFGRQGPKLSRHFTAAQLSVTNTGLPNQIPAMFKANAAELGRVLDQIYDASGGIAVTSAYRSPAVNDAVDGASGSHHLQALGADFYSTRGMDAAGLFQLVTDMDLPLAELIAYPTHVHIAIDPP